MPIRVTCPECGHSYAVNDELRGKKVRCRECEGVIPVGAAPKSGGGSEVREGPPRKQAPPPAKKGPTRRRDDDFEDDPPAKKGPALRRRDDDFEDDPPPPKRSAAVRRRDEDDEEDEAPRRKGKKGKAKKPTVLVWVAVGGGTALALAFLGFMIYLTMGPKSDVDTVANPGNGAPMTPPGMPPGGGPMMPPGGGGPGRPPDFVAGGGPTRDPGKGPPKDAGAPAPAPSGGGSAVASGKDVNEYVLKSVAWVLARHRDGAATGAGSLIDRGNRLVLTNYHVVHGGLEFVVFFPSYTNDGKLIREREWYERHWQENPNSAIHGRVVSRDERRDLALIQVDRLPESVEALPIAAGSPAVGETVHSVGNPGASGGLWGYTSGTVRNVYHKKWQAGRPPTLLLNLEAEVVETSNPTNPGDSGGPLVNGRGEMVGVTQGGSTQGNLVSFFIDRGEALDFIDKTFANRDKIREGSKGEVVLGEKWVRSDRPLLATGGGGGGLIPSLLAKLKNSDATVRAEGVQGLGQLGPDARLAVPDVLKTLKDPDETVRRFARDALIKLGPPAVTEVPAVALVLEDESPEVRHYALSVLAKIGPDGREAVPAVIHLLGHKDPKTRAQAVRTLGKIGAASPDRLTAPLNTALKDSDKAVRAAAAEVLAGDLRLTAADVPLLVGLLKHEDAEVRAQAAQGLKKVGASAREANGPLLAALKEGDAPVRRAILEALAVTRPDVKEAATALRAALKDKDLEVSRAALVVVGQLGPAATDMVPELARCLEERELRLPAMAALGQIGPPAAKQAAGPLANCLADRACRYEALAALTALKPREPETQVVVPKLIALFEDEADRDKHPKVADALGKIGKPAVSALRNALRSSKPSVQVGAAQSLGQIGPDAKAALSDLIALAKITPDPAVQREVLAAVRRISN
jgi:predicted Zn finger-like uncharacterized protein